MIRHAGASTCRISVSAARGSITVVVSDDGRGGESPFGSGLMGMRERIEALGGTLARDASRGTRLEIHLPLSSGGRDAAGMPAGGA